MNERYGHRWLFCLLALLPLAVPLRLANAVVTNGDFSDAVPLAGFTATGTVVGEPTGEFGQLDTDGTFLRTLEQTFVLPSTPSSLSFDFAFSTEASVAPAGFPDSFAVSLLTSADGDFLDILVADIFGPLPDPSDGIEGITGALPIEVLVDASVSIPGFVPFTGGTSFSGRASLLLPGAVLGEEATLFFDLFDELDGSASIAAVDNIEILALAVSEPASFVLLLLGLSGLVRGARWRYGEARRERITT